ncbi:MAG: Holliday junction branch migration protein RuvA [Spirochaetales bacterium]|nr:Holliday junction branch migration protein RuvA [Spirochaetales bacterium]
MWNSIKGVVTHIGAEVLYLENNGLEWEIEASASTLSRLPRDGKEVKVYTYLQHKEDGMKLYGFSSPSEKQLFLSVIGVSGVGPKLGLKILSGMKPEDFISALDREDVDSLSRIPGLGKKTAQKIILQLRGKLTGDDEAPLPAQAGGEIIEALAAMGFDKKLAARSVGKILESPAIKKLNGQDRDQEVMRLAIVDLSSAG